jgi:hypothetical protein
MTVARKLALLCAMAASLAAAATATAAEKAIWGPLELPDGRSALAMYERLGVDTLQLQINWARVAPARPADPANPADPAYRWPDDVARALAEAPRHGIEVALLITGAPGWANGGRDWMWAPEDPAEFATFAAAAARRYPSVRRWMIWGEPNMAARFRPNLADDPRFPQRYAQILDASYAALKGVDRRNVVIGGMTWTGGELKPAAFVKAMRLPDGRPPRLDWYGHNPYPFRYPDLAADVLDGGWRDMSDLDVFAREVQRALRPKGAPIPFWLSEFMIQSDGPSPSFETYVSRADQARWLTAAYDVADRLGDQVKGLGWFTLVDQAPELGGAHWGLLDTALRPKPAYAAFEAAPSVRHAPDVRAPRRVSRRALDRRGIVVRVRPRAAGPVVAELLRGTTSLAHVRRAGARKTIALRLRAGVRPGRYELAVRAPRGATVLRPLRVR